MRTRDIEITLKIPLPIDEPDLNGYIYTKDSIQNAVEDFNNKSKKVPLVTVDDKCYGYIDNLNLSLKTHSLIATGRVLYGGSCEDAEKDLQNKKIINKFWNM